MPFSSTRDQKKEEDGQDAAWKQGDIAIDRHKNRPHHHAVTAAAAPSGVTPSHTTPHQPAYALTENNIHKTHTT